MKEYETVIGLEVHVELATKTKIFCACPTDFGGDPNTHTCPVCTGMPGVLPVLNRQVVEYAMAVGLATNCNITRHGKFDRKNYFYPDNPQNYQISQLYSPIATDGWVMIEGKDGNEKKVRIHEIHMEEDAGKLVHDDIHNRSMVDLNRSGVPLIEIVSESDMNSSDEVISYLEKLRLIAQYLGVSDCKLNEGSMRADINISVREAGSNEYGTKTEMKNLNSFKAISRAIDSERDRQIDILESGEKVVQETRRWDDLKEYSYAMRSKEDAQDYRYFPDPDLVPVDIDDEWIEDVKSRQPEFRDEKIKRYVDCYDLPEYDAGIITLYKPLADLFESTVALKNNPKEVSNWIMGETMRLCREDGIEPDQIHFSAKNLSKLIQLVSDNVINRGAAKEVFSHIFREDLDPETYVEEHGLKQENNEDELRMLAAQVIEENPKAAADVRGGKKKAIGALVGQVMKKTSGKANPGVVNSILEEMLK